MQVPSHVEYERATSVEHALELLARFGPDPACSRAATA